jgi:hypothetical protein
MNTHSRTTARETFTHHRANLTFSIKPLVTQINNHVARSADEVHSRMDIVRKGLLGFAPAVASP